MNVDWTVCARQCREAREEERERTEILHSIETHARSRRRNDRVQEQARAHERARADHRPLASDVRDFDEGCTEEYTRHTDDRDDDAAASVSTTEHE